MHKTFAPICSALWIMVLLCVDALIPCSTRANATTAGNPVTQFGGANVTGLGTPNVTVNQTTPLAGINWTSLGNNPGDVLRFVQPSASAIALNRVVGADPSHFLGSLLANGSVIVINPNGVYFGGGAQVNVNGLIASSLNMTDAAFLSGKYSFDGSAANGMVRNEGQINAGPYGVYLIAPNVTNNGVITSAGGHLALAAGTSAYLSERADGRGLLVEVKAPAGEALNLKSLVSDGGQVSMIGRLVTQSGVVQANSAHMRNGKIELISTDRTTLTAGSVTAANGGQDGIADGGNILVKSDLASGQTTFESGAKIDVSGGVKGGNGGFAEVSAGSVSLGGQFLGRATSSYKGGRFLIDPLVVGSTVTWDDLQGFVGSGASDVEFRSPVGTDLTVNIGRLFNLIPVVDPNTGTVISGWALPPGQEGFLRFTAGKDLIFMPNSFIQNGSNSTGVSPAKWSYVLTAVNDIQFNGARLITGGGGSMSLTAGRDITLIPTSGVGQTTLQTFSANMFIAAGRDLIAPSALGIGVQPGPGVTYSGIRVDGPGNLTINADRDFLGGAVGNVPGGPGFVLSDGIARVNVGGNLGSPANYANFTLGSYRVDPVTQAVTFGKTRVEVTVGNNIYMGLMQDRGLSDRVLGQPLRPDIMNTFNPLSSASLLSDQGSIFLKSNTPDFVSGGSPDRNIYPSSFSALAPNGNISIASQLRFWPSEVGRLTFRAGQSIEGHGGLGSGDTPAISLICDSCNPITDPKSMTISPITVTAGKDITDLNLELVDPYLKTINVSAGNDIRNVFGLFAVPDLGKDVIGNPISAVTITANGNIDFAGRSQGNNPNPSSGFLFGGTGLARVTAGKTLDLAVSNGLTFQFQPAVLSSDSNSNAADKGGLLDVAVGGDIKMTQSRIQSFNGGNLFVHGLTTTQAPVIATTGLVSSAVVGTIIVNGQQVLAIAGVAIPGQDGIGPIPVNSSNQSLIGNPVYLVDGRAALDISGSPVLLAAKDTIVGQNAMIIAGNAMIGVNGKPVVVDLSSTNAVLPSDLVHGTAVLDRPLVHLADGTVLLVINGKTVTSVPAGSGPIDGRPTVSNGVVTLPVGGKQVAMVEPVGGAVNVGTNVNRVDDRTGILTVRGGAIDVKSTGNIDVNLSRIATLGGGNITLTSTTGNINAGSGSRNDVTSFVIEQPGPNNQPIRSFFSVPGSGIFTFHPADGDLPNIPPFNPLSPFEATVALHQFLGHDVSSLEPLIPAAHEAWVEQYKTTTEQLFAGFKLGDITLKASHDVIVPPAGIRGRNVNIDAGHNLDLQGGEIRGITNVNVGNALVGSLSSFIGVFAVNLGGITAGTAGSTLTLNSINGSVGTLTTTPAVTASVSTTSITGAKAADDVKLFEPVAESKKVGGGSGGGKSLSAPLRIKDKVRIRVETKPQPE